MPFFYKKSKRFALCLFIIAVFQPCCCILQCQTKYLAEILKFKVNNNNSTTSISNFLPFCSNIGKVPILALTLYLCTISLFVSIVQDRKPQPVQSSLKNLMFKISTSINQVSLYFKYANWVQQKLQYKCLLFSGGACRIIKWTVPLWFFW